MNSDLHVTRGARHALNVVIYMLLTLFLGACAGALVWAFFFLMNAGLSLLWDTGAPALNVAWAPVAICMLGGVIIGLFTRHFGDFPKEMNEVLAEVKETGRCDYSTLGRSFVGALLPLLFGGSVGPEAGLTGVIVGLCSWVGDRLRFMGEEFREFAAVGASAVVSAIFSAPLFGLAVPIAGSADGAAGADADLQIKVPKATKVVVYLCAVSGALGTMMLLSSLIGSGGGLPHFDGITIGARELALALPLALVGAAVGMLWFGADFVVGKLNTALGERPVLKAVLAGAALGLVGMFLPFVMFSGETQSEEIQSVYMQLGFAVLFLTALFKVVLTKTCIGLGWRGGHFFPLIFAGIALGFAASVLTGADAVFCLCVCTASLMGCVMRQPIMCALLLIMCFPVKAVFVLLIAAAIGAAVPVPGQKPAPQPQDKGGEGAPRQKRPSRTRRPQRAQVAEQEPAGLEGQQGAGRPDLRDGQSLEQVSDPQPRAQQQQQHTQPRAQQQRRPHAAHPRSQQRQPRCTRTQAERGLRHDHQ